MDNSFEDRHKDTQHYFEDIDENPENSEKKDFSFSFDNNTQKSKVNLDDFKILRLVGQGGFGKVYQVKIKKKNIKKKKKIQNSFEFFSFKKKNIFKIFIF